MTDITKDERERALEWARLTAADEDSTPWDRRVARILISTTEKLAALEEENARLRSYEESHAELSVDYQDLLEERERDDAVRATQAQRIEKLEAALRGVRGQLKVGMIVCPRCSHEEPTGDMDVILDIDAALTPTGDKEGV